MHHWLRGMDAPDSDCAPSPTTEVTIRLEPLVKYACTFNNRGSSLYTRERGFSSPNLEVVNFLVSFDKSLIYFSCPN